MLADQLTKMIDAASVVVVSHVHPKRGHRMIKFLRNRNPAWPAGKPRPTPRTPERVWMVWIEGHTYLRVRGRGIAATFATFEDAYLAALDAQLVPKPE